MANEISKIKLPNNTTYDIKDVSARSAAATAQSTADGKISSSLKGVANGVAELDANGLVPTSQLPSYVDDVLEYATKSVFPTMGESGKIYVDISTNLTYRWSGTAYVEISPSLALGETSSTAYRGDRGKTAYTHATDSNRLTTATAVGLYKVGATTQGHVSGLTAVAKADITALGIPAQDTTYSSGTGITISGTTINHSNSVTAGTAKGDNTKTLSFGGTFTIPTVTYDAQGHITAKGTTTMTMPSNPNTDTKVTAVGNHYTPAEDSTAQLDADASSTTAATWNSTSLVTGITVKRDAKGHVTGIAVDSIKMPANPNTNTTYTIGISGNNITLTPSSGSAQSITAPYATSAGSATKATQDGSGNTITSTYVKKSGDTMTGALTLYKEGTTNDNPPTELKFQNKNTTTGKTSYGAIRVYDGGESGSNLVIIPNGNMFIGSGEAAQHHYDLYTHSTAENFFATADTSMYLQANGQTIANRVGMGIYNDHSIRPIKADASTDNVGSIGTADYKWANGYFTNINGVAVGDSPKFTDTNNAVKQTVTTANANYEVLFSVTADNTTRTEGARKNSNLTFNPSTGTLTTKILMPNNTYDATWINCGKHPNIYIDNTKAAPWITGNTKNGRIALCSYASNDDKLYFNYWTNTTLAGTTNTVDKQMTWDASNGTLTTATFVGALTGHASSDLALSGGTMTGNINFPAGKSIYSKDSANRDYALIYDNGNNLWIGATSSTGNHHTGSEASTYISAGYNTTHSKGNDTIYVSVPTLTGSTWGHTAYAVLHVGNTSFTRSLSSGTKIGTIKINGTSTDLYCQTNTNTHRPIQVDGTEVLGNNTTALNLVAGTNVSLSNDGGAVTITATDTNNAVAITNTNPTTGTWYYPVWHSSTSATSTGLKANDGFRHYSLQGTTSAVGRTILSLGNGTATGAAGNKYGTIRLYAEKTGYADIVSIASATSGTIHTLPATGGTILNTGTTSFTRSLSSGTKIGTIKINGTSTDLYCQTNTNDEVTQTIDNSTNSDFRLLMSATSDDTTLTEGAKKTTGLRYNPYYQRLQLLADSSSRGDVFEVLYKDPEIAGYIVSARIDADGSATFRGLSLGGNIIPGNTYSIGTESSKWGDLYVTTIMGGTCVNTQYKDNTTNTTGFVMHGRTNGNKYSCIWQNSKLNFYVDTTNVGNISDRQLKSEIDEIDPRLMEAIAECKIYQYKAFNRDGLISVGIMAQDLVEKCEEKGVRPENYELLTKMNFIQGDDTLYYSVDYNQYATFMIDYLQKKVKELEEKIK